MCAHVTYVLCNISHLEAYTMLHANLHKTEKYSGGGDTFRFRHKQVLLHSPAHGQETWKRATYPHTVIKRLTNFAHLVYFQYTLWPPTLWWHACRQKQLSASHDDCCVTALNFQPFLHKSYTSASRLCTIILKYVSRMKISKKWSQVRCGFRTNSSG
jgi:hypothetical protein